MSTPFHNSVGVTSYSPIGGNGGALQYGTKWGGAYGDGVTLTYSFPGKTAWHVDGYDEYQSYYPLTAPEKDAVRDALAAWSAVADIAFVEVGDDKNTAGDLRFAVTDTAGNEAAHAYMPGTSPRSGDIWFANGAWHDGPGTTVKKGTYDYLVILHEIGHAIGLEHAFGEAPNVAKARDSFAYTVMSYSATPGEDNYASFYPTTPMYYDLVAIQGIYGRGVHNAGDTVYTYRKGASYWETIDDSGGTDTIVHKGKDKAVIDLRTGEWSDLGRSIGFSSGSTKKTVMIGPGTVIENATGGKGKDKLIGNDAANVLTGGKGKDKLTGGAGDDTFVFSAKLKKGNADKITDFGHGDDVIAVAQKFAKALDKGVVDAAGFADHFTYKAGKLSYDGKLIAKLGGAPELSHHDLLVV